MDTFEERANTWNGNSPGSSLRDFLSVLRRGLPIAIIVGALAAGLAYWASLRLEPEYTASALLLMSDARPSNPFGVTLLTAPALAPSAYEAAVHSGPVLDDALATLKAEGVDVSSRDSLIRQTHLEVELDDPSTIFRMVAVHSDAESAAKIANALSESLRAWDQQRARSNVDAMIAALEANLQALDSQVQRALSADLVDDFAIQSLRDQRADNMVSLETAKALRTSAVGYIESLESAVTPRSPSSPHPVRSAVLAFGVGIVIAYVLVVARMALATRYRDPEELSEHTGLPVLAVYQKAPTWRLSKETANFLRASVLSQLTDLHPKVILVTSARESEGKTSVSLSLAESIARSNYRTVLVDADLRRPSVAHMLRTPGLGNEQFVKLLRDPMSQVRPRVVKTSGLDLHVLAGKQPVASPSELIAAGFGDAVTRLGREYDVIIVDSAPLLPVADTLSIAPHVSASLMVVNISKSDRRGVSSATRLLGRLGTRLLGVVVTQASKESVGGSEYGYGYGGYGDMAAHE